MVITSRARLLIICATLATSPLGGALADPAIKPAITGLVSTGSSNNTLNQLNKYMGIFGGLVVQATWAELQPNSSSDFITTGIDNALNAVSNYNAAAPSNRQIGVRLRVFAGCTDSASDAPGWAMNLDGGPITITAPYNGASETCTFGNFWESTTSTPSAYATKWQQLQTMLAAKYDTNPLIQEVAVTSCTSFSAEPFFMPTLSSDEQTALLNAGYSDTSYQQCLANAVAVYAPWQTTRLEFSFNPFYQLTSPTLGDIGFSDRVMRACRQAAGQRCILSNHDLDTQTPSSILPIYTLERKFGPNITFQTLHVAPADFEGTIRKGISLGAGSIEVWQEPAGFEAQLSATLQNWASMFEPQ